MDQCCADTFSASSCRKVDDNVRFGCRNWRRGIGDSTIQGRGIRESHREDRQGRCMLQIRRTWIYDVLFSVVE